MTKFSFSIGILKCNSFQNAKTKFMNDRLSTLPIVPLTEVFYRLHYK